MGRDSGYIAVQVALAGGCEEVIIPEREMDMDVFLEEISAGRKKGKISWIVIVAEGKAKAQDVAETIIKKTGFETRVAVLGYIQRGGSPTAVDRILAARLGSFAVEVLRRGESDKCVCLNENKLSTIPLEIATQPKQIEIENYYRLIKILT
jgi:6-phosphofructokinase 1